jgi:hypothetical protein
MNKTILFFLLIFGSISLLQISCKEESPVKQEANPLQLTVEDATCTEAFLKISLAASELNRTVLLKRGDSSIATITMASSDSLFVDEGLLPKKNYTYSLVANSWKVTAQATTQDTTSHNMQWQSPDTLGAQGLIRDVWVFSKTDAWAVGQIYLKDSSGKLDQEHPYNAAHWDGKKWELKKILVKDFGTGTGYYQLYAIFAFGPNDIWFAGDGDFIHWDGIKFTSKAFFATQLPFNGQVRKIWGTSSNNLFCVGRTGSIYHYTGVNNWTKIGSNTTVDLEDIWGIDETHIWATGTNFSGIPCSVLQYDGKNWSVVYTSEIDHKYGFSSVWTYKPEVLYLSGNSGTWTLRPNVLSFNKQSTNQTYNSYRVRGTQRNDIFISGAAGEVTHFNGSSWTLYPEIKILNNSSAFVDLYSIYPTNDFLLIGGSYFTGLNSFPVVIRGYR